jgi:branched-chain amino acid transport system ATP-binding protein
MLEVAGLEVAFGGRRVLHAIDLTVGAGEIVALIGHNGAGKTTLLRSIMGLLRPVGGRIVAAGAPVSAGRSAAVARAGLAFVPQGRNVFRDLTVAENLALSREAAGAAALPERVAFELFPVLAERRAQVAGSLSGGQQQMLGLGIALLRRPKLIMLDEPSTGLAPILVEEVFRAVATLQREYGTGFLIVDQNVRALLSLSQRVYVLKSGRVVHAGQAASLDDSETLWSLF